MAPDAAWVAAQYERMNQRNTFSGGDFWQIEKGQNFIRLVNAPTPEQFALEVVWHFGVFTVSGGGPPRPGSPSGEPDKGNFYCLEAMSGTKCPVCELIREMRSTRNAQITELAKKIGKKPKIYFNLLDRRAPTKGIQKASVPPTVYKGVLGIMMDPSYGDIIDPRYGRDVRIDRAPVDSPTMYSVFPGANPTMLAYENEIEPLLKQAYSLREIAEQPGPQDVAKMNAAVAKLRMQLNMTGGTPSYVVGTAFPTISTQTPPAGPTAGPAAPTGPAAPQAPVSALSGPPAPPPRAPAPPPLSYVPAAPPPPPQYAVPASVPPGAPLSPLPPAAPPAPMAPPPPPPTPPPAPSGAPAPPERKKRVKRGEPAVVPVPPPPPGATLPPPAAPPAPLPQASLPAPQPAPAVSPANGINYPPNIAPDLRVCYGRTKDAGGFNPAVEKCMVCEWDPQCQKEALRVFGRA